MTNAATVQRALSVEEKRALITLSLVPGVGWGKLRALVAMVGSASAVMRAPAETLARIQGIGPQTAKSVKAFDDEGEVERQIAQAVRVKARMISWWDDRFPFLLREIYDPPAFMWVRGRLPEADGPEKAIAIVGTRRPTDYGKRVAYDFAHSLAARGMTVVSGLAYGIDAAAHRGALDAGGRTVAVLGSGVDRIYPGHHARLAQRIVEQGAVVSEFPMAAKPDAPNFPRRNRIVSGMTLGTLVVEAYEDGGALITARLALEQNREVFAIPGPIHSSASAGVHALIRDGHAKLVQRLEDVFEELGFSNMASEGASVAVELEPLEERICRVLSPEPMHIDRICEAAGLDPSSALVYLLSLEFKGIVGQLAGKQFFLLRSPGVAGHVG